MHSPPSGCVLKSRAPSEESSSALLLEILGGSFTARLFGLTVQTAVYRAMH